MNAASTKVMIVLVGLPASGKSTLSSKQFSDIDHVNLDTLKTRANESNLLQDLIKEGKDFVVDNTNVSVTDRKRYIDLVKPHGYKCVCLWINTPKSVCIERNKERDNKVPIIAIHTLAKKFEEPEYEEGFDTILGTGPAENYYA